MKKHFSLYSLLLFIQVCFADIPIEDNYITEIVNNNFNYLPWAIGVLFAAGIMAFIYTLKKAKNESK